MNLGTAYKKTFARLETISDATHDAHIDTMVLLEHITHKSKSFILAHPEYQLTQHQIKRLHGVTKRRLAHEPTAYIIGHAFFYNLQLHVTRSVLIPRPATELLITTALEYMNKSKKKIFHLADIGTGSGAIIIALAHNYEKNASFVASDLSIRALNIAKKNAKRYKIAGKIQFKKSDLFKDIGRRKKFDMIISNLPYVSEKDFYTSPTHRELLYEPKSALVPGRTGLELFESFLEEAKKHIKKDGIIIMEIGYDQGDTIKKMAKAIFPKSSTQITNDLCGFNRMITVCLSSAS